MARIEGVPHQAAGPVVRLVYRFMRKGTRKLTGTPPASGSGIEPIELWAHRPKMLSAMGRFQGAVRKGDSVPERIRTLVELKASAMIGCEYCIDLGSQIARTSGITDDELLALPHHRDSDLFSTAEQVALDYAVGVMRTPVEVDEDLFARAKEHFSVEQLVELTALLTVVNLNRFNAAFGVESAGFSEGMVCIPPERRTLAA